MEYELLSASQRDAIVAEHLREYLAPLGLTEITTRTWVDGSQAPVRRLFELVLLKGAAMKACWGFSLDFVPHISGGRVRWHRTNKSARLDIIVDPRGLVQPSFIHGAKRFSFELRGLLSQATGKAQETWKRGATMDGMFDIIREIRERKINCFGFYNYIQVPLAYAFLSAKSGDLHTAEQELDHYVTSHGLDDEEAATLKRLAREYSIQQVNTDADANAQEWLERD